MQVLSPGVQDGHQPDLGTEMLGIGSDDAQRLSGGREQDAVDDGLIVERDLSDRRRHSEDDVEVRYRQQLGLSVGQPLSTCQSLALRAVPVAAANGRCPLPALWGAIGNGELAKAPSGPGRDPARIHSPLRIDHSKAFSCLVGRKYPLPRCGRTAVSTV